MKIHLITNLFHPDELAGAALYTDLALYLQERGHEVRVTTTFSYYPAWQLRPEDQGCRLRDELFTGIPVRRIAMHVPREVTGKARLISDLSFLAGLIRHAEFSGWQPDVVVTSEPMLSQVFAQRFLYRRQRIPRLIVVQDFVVDAALELGILKLPGVAGFLHAIERWALNSATKLVTISPQMVEKLDGKVRGARPVRLIPNWIHGSLQAEIDRQKHLPVKRAAATLFYAGNVGVKQGLPDFLADFESIDSGWKLQIQGGGSQAAQLRASAAITLGGVMDESAYVAALQHATACLITQKLGIGANFLPSKLLPALATGTPVLAFCDRGSPLGEEVRSGGFGEVVRNRAELAEALARWSCQPALREMLSHRATERAALYRRDRILSQYETELCRLVSAAN